MGVQVDGRFEVSEEFPQLTIKWMSGWSVLRTKYKCNNKTPSQPTQPDGPTRRIAASPRYWSLSSFHYLEALLSLRSSRPFSHTVGPTGPLRASSRQRPRKYLLYALFIIPKRQNRPWFKVLILQSLQYLVFGCATCQAGPRPTALGR